MEAVVWYSVPIAVHVDTDAGEVTRVVVIDEEVNRDEGAGVTEAEGYPTQVPTAVAQAAVGIAETAVWTRWEYGY